MLNPTRSPHLKAVPAYPEPSHGGECPFLFVKLCHNTKLISLKERHNYALWMTNSNLLSSRISNDSELRRERPVGYWRSANCVVQAKMTTAVISDPPSVRISIESSQPIVRFNLHSNLLRWELSLAAFYGCRKRGLENSHTLSKITNAVTAWPTGKLNPGTLSGSCSCPEVLEVETWMPEPAWRQSETGQGGWLSLGWGQSGRAAGFLACWSRRHSFSGRHRGVQRRGPCRPGVQIQMYIQGYGVWDWRSASNTRCPALQLTCIILLNALTTPWHVACAYLHPIVAETEAQRAGITQSTSVTARISPQAARSWSEPEKMGRRTLWGVCTLGCTVESDCSLLLNFVTVMVCRIHLAINYIFPMTQLSLLSWNVISITYCYLASCAEETAEPG